MTDVQQARAWVVYIIECGDGTLYTGITTNLERRMAEHRSGKGAKYTKGRLPLTFIYTEILPTRSAASKREAAIKALDKKAKYALAAHGA